MKLIEILTEDVHQDIEMHAIVDKVRASFMGYVYAEGKYDFELDWNSVGRFFVYKPTTLKVDHLGFTDVLFAIGERNGSYPSGAVIHQPSENREGPFKNYGRMLTVFWIPPTKMTPTPYLKPFGSDLKVASIIEHEAIHILDGNRTGNKSLKVKPKLASEMNNHDDLDIDEYINSPREFNAFYHQVADRLFSVISELKAWDGTSMTASDIADLYYISDDFFETLKKSIGDDLILKQFMKWIRSDRRKALLKRLYQLHKEAMRLINIKNRAAISKFKDWSQ